MAHIIKKKTWRCCRICGAKWQKKSIAFFMSIHWRKFTLNKFVYYKNAANSLFSVRVFLDILPDRTKMFIFSFSPKVLNFYVYKKITEIKVFRTKFRTNCRMRRKQSFTQKPKIAKLSQNPRICCIFAKTAYICMYEGASGETMT